MSKITVEKPSKEKLAEMKTGTWGDWGCCVSEFDWHYDDRETCYILEGRVEVEAEGEIVSFGPGDLVVFPKGLSCRWKVTEPVRKKFRFG